MPAGNSHLDILPSPQAPHISLKTSWPSVFPPPIFPCHPGYSPWANHTPSSAYSSQSPRSILFLLTTSFLSSPFHSYWHSAWNSVLGCDEIVGNLLVNGQNSRKKVPPLTLFEICLLCTCVTGSFLNVSSGPRICIPLIGWEPLVVKIHLWASSCGPLCFCTAHLSAGPPAVGVPAEDSF